MKKILLLTFSFCAFAVISNAQNIKNSPPGNLRDVNHKYCKIKVTGTVANVACYGDASGAIDITVTHTKGVVSYSWSNGSTTEDLAGVPAGDYTVIVTDETKRKTSATFTVTQPSSPLVVTPKIKPASSSTTCDGAVFLKASGGNPLYSFAWSDGSTSSCKNDLCPGTYKVCVTDSNGCTVTTKITIPVAGSFSADASDENAMITKDKASAMASPNPTKGLVLLSFGAKVNGTAAMNIYNMSGRKVTTEKFSVTAGTNNKQINLSNFSKGVYNVELLVDGQKRTVKVLLQ